MFDIDPKEKSFELDLCIEEIKKLKFEKEILLEACKNAHNKITETANRIQNLHTILSKELDFFLTYLERTIQSVERISNMQTLEEAGFCRYCDAKVLVKKQVGTAVLGNLFMTLITCGLWIIVWSLMSSLSYLGKWKCSRCGNYAAKLI